MMGIGWGELAALLVIGLIIMGPDRLPQITLQVVRAIRQLRSYAEGAKRELTDTVAPHVQQWQEASAPVAQMHQSLQRDWDEVVGGDTVQGHSGQRTATPPAPPTYPDAT